MTYILRDVVTGIVVYLEGNFSKQLDIHKIACANFIKLEAVF